MNSIEFLFRDKAIERNGISLYSKKDALEFINECFKENIILLGIDGFFLTDQTIRPSMENSIDFSSTSFKGEIYEKAKSFLNEQPDNLFFEITCDD